MGKVELSSEFQIVELGSLTLSRKDIAVFESLDSTIGIPREG
jgi:hypothetical protein